MTAEKNRKILAGILAALTALLGFLAFFTVGGRVARAEEETGGYFYAQLSAQGQKFYAVLERMCRTDEDGNSIFLRGEACELVKSDYADKNQPVSFSEGKLLLDFSAARDAFQAEHPELFYIDFSRLSPVSTVRSGRYTVYIGAERSATYFNGFSDGMQISSAVQSFDSRTQSLVHSVGALTDEREKILALADALSSVHYAVGALNATAYGPLVSGTGNGEGTARAFVRLANEAGIPCLCVKIRRNGKVGYLNYVHTADGWLGLDVLGEARLFGAEESSQYTQEGVLSEGGKEFSYPTLAGEGQPTAVQRYYSAVFGAEPLYRAVCSIPTVLSADRLQEACSWTAEQKEELNLVSRYATEAEEREMLLHVSQSEEEAGERYSLSAYVLSLQTAEGEYEMPNGCRLSVGLPYPPECGYNTKDRTYKVYCISEGSDKAEEVASVRTAYGLVVDLQKAGKYAVVAYKGTQKTVGRNFYLRQTEGGTVSVQWNDGAEYVGSGVYSLQKGDRGEFIIRPQENKKLVAFILNGKEMRLPRAEDDLSTHIAFDYEDLKENDQAYAVFLDQTTSDRLEEQGQKYVYCGDTVINRLGSFSLSLKSYYRTEIDPATQKKVDVFTIETTLQIDDAVALADIKYVWYRDGQVLEGQNGDTLRIYGTTARDEGTYSVEVQYGYQLSVGLLQTQQTTGLYVDRGVQAEYSTVLLCVAIALSAAMLCAVYVLLFRKKGETGE